jgi:hypothetical protein
MKIEAVTVCVDYSHYLKQVISNKNKLDRWVIVTHKSDKDTIKLCKKENIEFVLSKKIFKNAKFAKGKAINEGLDILEKKDWILHLDADQLLPENFRDELNSINLNKKNLYGSYRYSESGYKFGPVPVFWTIKGKTKIIRKSKSYYIPIGHFQLWHSCVCQHYVENSKNTMSDDFKFVLSWRNPGESKKEFREKLIMLNLKLIDVCGFSGCFNGHRDGIRNMKK